MIDGNEIMEEQVQCVCSDNNNITKSNCQCTPCEAVAIQAGVDDIITSVPILGKKILNCTSITKNDVGVNQTISFTVNSNSGEYSNGDLICIQSLSIRYNFIGLSNLLVNNLETFIDGSIYTLTPDNEYAVGTNGSKGYLFTSSSGNIKIKNNCCNTHSYTSRSIRIVESGRFFEVDNLQIYVSGCIGNLPFTATADLTDRSNKNESTLRLTSLGISSSSTFEARICWNNTEAPVNIYEEYKPVLNADCVRTLTNYRAPDAEKDYGSFLASVDFSFCVNKSIFITQNLGIPVLSDVSVVIPCSSIQNKCIEGDC